MSHGNKWVWEQVGDTLTLWQDPDRIRVLRTDGEIDPTPAQAAVIAAAPKLLEACRIAERFCDEQAQFGLCVPELQIIRAAIAKAEGSAE